MSKTQTNRFRPCIDIHDGKVKQIVGSTLTADGMCATSNFVSKCTAEFFALKYKTDDLRGGHIILLNQPGTQGYADCKTAAMSALKAFPGGLHIGGGITDKTAAEFLRNGASHVIVTSFVFQGGEIDYNRLRILNKKIGKDKLVLDLSVKRNPRDKKFYIVTNRWTVFTDEELTVETMAKLTPSCDEFLIHAVDAEGKQSGIETDVLEILKNYRDCYGNEVTYAGGIHNFSEIGTITENNVNFTVGSALDIFGGELPYDEIKFL
ncbi:MAG: phosphoribosylformimino-5-aminoimidazole carboxamide ribotide isomerase [Ruminococcus sp.]|jgi:phosphoribosylformimino-5-aminoimidazole carboxamide ribotide isomerase|nr:phosphoribosylformimino-5-aminoimidazole carboxamide ribotide isomerase [Ruminococcus sp.]